jgi:hypothetical protein
MKQPECFVPAADVRGSEPSLTEDTGRKVTALADLAIHGDFSTLRKLIQARA